MAQVCLPPILPLLSCKKDCGNHMCIFPILEILKLDMTSPMLRKLFLPAKVFVASHSLADSRRQSSREGLWDKVSAASSRQIRSKWPSRRSPRSTLGCPEVRDNKGCTAQLLLGPTDCLTHPLCHGSQAMPFPPGPSGVNGEQDTGPSAVCGEM